MNIKLWDKTPYYNEEYGQPEPELKVFRAINTPCRSAVIVLPGGAYSCRAAHEADPIAMWLNSIGITAFVLSYRVAPYTYRAITGDALRAIRVVRYNAEKFDIDADKIGILGFSAGGHLCSSAAVHFDDFAELDKNDPIDSVSSRPDAAILCYPVISSDPELWHKGSFENLLGEEFDNPELLEFFSNEKQIKPNTPPTFLWHTAEDAGVPVENSLCFAMGLAKQNIPYEMHIYPHGCHGLGLGFTNERVITWTQECAQWLKTIDFR